MTSLELCFVFSLMAFGCVAQLGDEFVTKADLQALASRIQTQETQIEALKTKVQLQETKIQSQEIKIQLLQGQLKSKQDRTPLVSFRAGFSQDPVPIKYSNDQTVVFDHIYLNDGNAYIEHSGMFHAPYSGLYIFTLQVLPSSSEIEFAIIKEGATVAYLVSTSTGGTESIKTLIHLHKGQDVWVRKTWGGDTLRGQQLTTFSGFLLRIDEDNSLVSNGGSHIVG